MEPSLKQTIDNRVLLYQYTDYRLYLKHYFQERKKQDPTFSYRAATEFMGFNSRGYLHQIIAGDVKKLTSTQIYRISEYLKQTDTERDFFFNLVFYNQAEDITEREYFFGKMHDFIDPKQGQSLQKDYFEYFSQWYIPVLRELITMKSFDGSLSKLAKTLNPPITLDECRQGVEILKRLGLIDSTQTGRYFQTQVNLNVGPEIQAMAWRKLVEQLANLGQESLRRHPSAHRDVSGLTIGVTAEGVQILTSMLHNLRTQIVEMLPEWDDAMDRVYQLNLQLFPLSTIPK